MFRNKKLDRESPSGGRRICGFRIEADGPSSLAELDEVHRLRHAEQPMVAHMCDTMGNFMIPPWFACKTVTLHHGTNPLCVSWAYILGLVNRMFRIGIDKPP